MFETKLSINQSMIIQLITYKENKTCHGYLNKI